MLLREFMIGLMFLDESVVLALDRKEGVWSAVGRTLCASYCGKLAEDSRFMKNFMNYVQARLLTQCFSSISP